MKSGNDTEYKGTLYLAAGRPIRCSLEFFRSTLGVQKKDKAKTPAGEGHSRAWNGKGRGGRWN